MDRVLQRLKDRLAEALLALTASEVRCEMLQEELNRFAPQPENLRQVDLGDPAGRNGT